MQNSRSKSANTPAARTSAAKTPAANNSQPKSAGTSAKTRGEPDQFVYVQSPLKLRHKTGPMRQRNFDPVAAAEKQLKATAPNFDNWVHNDRVNLAAAWRQFSQAPRDDSAFLTFNKAVHVIKGNAPILGREGAGMLASSLAILLERCSNPDRVETVVALTVNAICTAIDDNLPGADATLREIALQLDELNSRCGQIRSQAADKTNICADVSFCKANVYP